MSKFRIGNYDTGEPKFIYFRKHKHHRVVKNGFRSIRWKMYLANSIKLEFIFNNPPQ